MKPNGGWPSCLEQLSIRRTLVPLNRAERSDFLYNRRESLFSKKVKVKVKVHVFVYVGNQRRKYITESCLFMVGSVLLGLKGLSPI